VENPTGRTLDPFPARRGAVPEPVRRQLTAGREPCEDSQVGRRCRSAVGGQVERLTRTVTQTNT
jgi:hypothetical protein